MLSQHGDTEGAHPEPLRMLHMLHLIAADATPPAASQGAVWRCLTAPALYTRAKHWPTAALQASGSFPAPALHIEPATGPPLRCRLRAVSLPQCGTML